MSKYSDFLAAMGVGGAHPGGLALTKQWASAELINSTTAILDVGCGTGLTSAFLKQAYDAHVVSLDSHAVMLEKAKRRFQALQLDIEVVEGSAEHIPKRDESFDFIIAESVISFTRISDSLKECFRILKKNGTFIMIEMTSLTSRPLNDVCEFYGIQEVLTEKEWQKNLYDIGFQKVITQSFLMDEFNHDEDYFTEFSLSENIDSNLFDYLAVHEQLLKKYEKEIGYRLYKCIK